MDKQKNVTRKRIAFIIILTNLIIGNGILFIGGKSSFTESVNYPLMGGMSIACTLFYILFFKFSSFETFKNLKLAIYSVLGCMVIVFFGNFFAVIIKEIVDQITLGVPVNLNILATIVMGIMGNIIMFPISLLLGVLNFILIIYLKKN